MTAFELREWREGDIDALSAAANNPGIAANPWDAFPYPYTRGDANLLK